MSIKNKTESDERKETGKRFQELVRDAILYRFKSTFSWLSHDDITSCKMCGHGEDIKLKERFRAMIPVCIECRYREKGAGMQTIYSWFEEARQHKAKLGFIHDIIPILAIQKDIDIPLWIMSQDDAISLFHKIAKLESDLNELQQETDVNQKEVQYETV